MRKEITLLISRQFVTRIFKSRAVFLLLGITFILLIYAAISGVSYHDHNHFRTDHQEMARESWEDNPDKHPHRMAHFGTFAFRIKHPLSIFDFGIESYTGNAVFLEAHKQNMVNFSEASFSTGLLRFGELSMAMILQVILPLIIFFMGYSAIVSDRENGTLKILLTQGASWKEILFGKSLGIMTVTSLFSLPFFIVAAVLLIIEGHTTTDVWVRLSIIIAVYLLFMMILCLITTAVSVSSRSSKDALVKLLGVWLIMVVLLPRTSQAVGTYIHPTPTKQEFRSAIEEEVIRNGDSHNPDDPLFKALKDSVLSANNVESITELPFNYGGFVMAKGERLSTEIYNKHNNLLLEKYRDQGRITRVLAIVNPYLAVKNLSMALTGTDFESYVSFQQQAENYRYELAQKMNELQMKYIGASVSSSEGAMNVVSREEWKDFPDFKHHHLSIGTTIQNELLSIFSIIIWTVLALQIVLHLSKKAKAI